MRFSIAKIALAAFVIVAINGCQSGLGLPRWDWWRSADNSTSDAGSLAGSPYANPLPSQTAQPGISSNPYNNLSNSQPGAPGGYPGSGTRSYGTPGGAGTLPSYNPPSGYPGSPYPNPGFAGAMGSGSRSPYPSTAANTGGTRYPMNPSQPKAGQYPSTGYPGSPASYNGTGAAPTQQTRTGRSST